MNKLRNTRMIYGLIAVILLIAAFMVYKRQIGQTKVSEFGKYRGYSEKTYEGNQRRSEYLTLSNGTRLAYDLILPTKKGVPANKPLPVLFKYTPYLRTFTIFDKDGNNIIAGLFNLGWKEKAYLRIRYWSNKRGNLMDPVFRTKYLENMLNHGYAVIVVERPGTGASFGIMNGSFEVGGKEVNEILDWIAAQNWCDGNIGMYGDSFQAMIQFAAAAAGNPHLKAIFPTSSGLDTYSAVTYPGGVFNKIFASFFSWSTSFLEHVVTPVDGDKDGSLLAQARKERAGSTLAKQSEVWFRKFPFRDSITSDGNKVWEGPGNLYPLLDRINQSRTPVYMTTGWYDLFSGADDMFLWYANLTVPRRLLVRPADHSEVEKNQFDLDFGSEAHRWFDYWLKGINNGMMDESPIHYYVQGVGKKEAWQTTEVWPLKNQQMARYYFGKGETEEATSVNNGALVTSPITAPEASDAYTADYSTTSGKNSRWNAVNWPRKYPDMRSNDKKALTYTTSPLQTDVEVTGHPVVHLWLRTDAPDLDAFVYLEEVAESGKSIYITEGNLRASHRKLRKAPYINLELPYHSHYQSDLMPIPGGEPFELFFSLLSTSYRFQKGSRIRITVAFADSDNFDTPVIDPAPKVHLLRDRNHPSSIQLPVVQSR
ncbi:MAG TPA: CocE/NonD family hydrolase [Thermodesulfobacteriota bacterium]|nr:CocE/NonD family hydrolase [Thermodesulfobacteriota bacterium]